jgi:hypothetical protein
MAKLTKLERSHRKTWTKGGETFTAEVSPCSWMYPGYGLQISVRKKNGGGSPYTVRCAETKFEFATTADFDRLCAGVKVAPCTRPGCRTGTQFVDPTSNRKGWCEPCFLAKWQAECDQIQARMAEREKKYDAKMRARGMRYKVVAWIHAGGDDKQVVIYYPAKPIDETVKAQLRKMRSRVLNDYTIAVI